MIILNDYVVIDAETTGLNPDNGDRITSISGLKVIGSEHFSMASSLHNLGSALKNLKRYDEAEHFLLKALDIRSKIFGSENAATINSKKQIMSMYREWGKLEEVTKYRDAD
jgi:DNA polymerase III epsilon subunit-like protein